MRSDQRADEGGEERRALSHPRSMQFRRLAMVAAVAVPGLLVALAFWGGEGSVWLVAAAVAASGVMVWSASRICQVTLDGHELAIARGRASETVRLRDVERLTYRASAFSPTGWVGVKLARRAGSSRWIWFIPAGDATGFEVEDLLGFDLGRG